MTHAPIACTLTTKDAADQGLEWSTLGRHALSLDQIDNGATMTFPIDREADVRDLAAREAACCGFLTLTVDALDDSVQLSITSDNPEAMPVIEVLSGLIRQ